VVMVQFKYVKLFAWRKSVKTRKAARLVRVPSSFEPSTEIK
jgi:hypothetical protein